MRGNLLNTANRATSQNAIPSAARSFNFAKNNIALPSLFSSVRHVTYTNPRHPWQAYEPEWIHHVKPKRDKDGKPVNVKWEPIIRWEDEVDTPVLRDNYWLTKFGFLFPWVVGLCMHRYIILRDYWKKGHTVNWPMISWVVGVSVLVALLMGFTYGFNSCLFAWNCFGLLLQQWWLRAEWRLENLTCVLVDDEMCYQKKVAPREDAEE